MVVLPVGLILLVVLFTLLSFPLALRLNKQYIFLRYMENRLLKNLVELFLFFSLFLLLFSFIFAGYISYTNACTSSGMFSNRDYVYPGMALGVSMILLLWITMSLHPGLKIIASFALFVTGYLGGGLVYLFIFGFIGHSLCQF